MSVALQDERTPIGVTDAFASGTGSVVLPLYPVRERDVDDAIGWLDDHWRGGVFVPDELLPLVAVA
jgi:hypothetical protein